MKRYLTLLILVLFSCNTATNEKSMEHSEMDDSEINAISALDIEKSNFNELNLIEEKLQDSYDLVYLTEKNSDFETTKLSSSVIIKNLILDNLDNHNFPTITDIQQIGNLESLNDSITHINFRYILKQGNSEIKDTLKAIMHKQNVTIEGQTKTSIKIDFTSYKD
ncbi:hypothetical protein [Winogradskyella psychrotolerans]|uniref:hypothetical protein n=1 Tax=Winogradskyella psychrotolerans TaxID=1344585 RepID=UPI001C074946|nr:hypothetical protein [Winogradskyella psychrotolerans]MBU2928807.1 hypothetical protein [Winogradskyella psychrotolerans]